MFEKCRGRGAAENVAEFILLFMRRSRKQGIVTLSFTQKMTTRPTNSATALRRLMTEYKQLTAGGERLFLTLTSLCFDVGYAPAGSPDGMFTAGQYQ